MCLRYSEADLKVLLGWVGQVVGEFVVAGIALLRLVTLLELLGDRVVFRLVVGEVGETVRSCVDRHRRRFVVAGGW